MYTILIVAVVCKKINVLLVYVYMYFICGLVHYCYTFKSCRLLGVVLLIIFVTELRSIQHVAPQYLSLVCFCKLVDINFS